MTTPSVAPCTRLDPDANPAMMNTASIPAAWASASSPMPSTLPISSWTGRTVDSSTSTTRLDFSSPMPIAICDPYTLISTQMMTTVNSPVSRDDSDVEGASRPRTGSVDPVGHRVGRARHGLDQLGQPGKLCQRPDGTGHAAKRHLLDDDLLAGDEDSAQVAAAQRGLGRRLTRLGNRDRLAAGQPARLGDDAAGRGRGAADDADTVRLALPGQDRRERHGQGDRDQQDRGRDHERPRLGPELDLPAGHQPGQVQRPAGRAALPWPLVPGPVLSVPVLIAVLPSLPRWSC